MGKYRRFIGRGGTDLILRKGCIAEGQKAGLLDHDNFPVPTLFHQQRDSVIARAQSR